MKTSSKATSTTVALLLVLLAGFVVAASQQAPGSQEKPTRFENYLPEGVARNLVLEGCVQCHELQNTVSQRKTEVGWRRTVNEMIWRGAPLGAEESEVIIRYLTVSFGPDKPLPEAFKKKPEKQD